ncbi:MAG: epoxyqueuosine reductase [Parasporobacterium sp.]|nr:epoxyqueuosine reductase [Parasporobacterium sp.]
MKDRKNYKEELRQWAFANGMSKFGVAPVDRFGEARRGQKPEDLLPGAKSVIVMCIKLLDGATSAIYRKYEDGMDDVHGIYGTYGYTLGPTFHQAVVVSEMANKIEMETGELALPSFTGGPLVNGGAFSLRHAANAAGLGEFGWNGLMLTPEFGPRNRFCAVITTLELEPDPMYHGPRLCNPEQCHICVDACPTGAITMPGTIPALEVHCGDKTSAYCALINHKCKMACHTIVKAAGGKEDLVSLDASEPEVEHVLDTKPFEKEGMQGNPTWRCGQCLTNCPVGNWKGHFYDTGLVDHLLENKKQEETTIEKEPEQVIAALGLPEIKGDGR